MNIITKYTSRDYLRNGKLNLNGGVNSSYSSGSYGSVVAGNYLPATSNGDGTYTVDLTQVIFNGNVIAQGEVAAYKSGLTSGETSGVTSGTIDIEDNLTSDRTDAALSANQGRILKGLIDNFDTSNIDLTNYYTKTEVDSKFANYSGNTNLEDYVKTVTFSAHTADTTVHITAEDKTTINNINDWFYKDENNNIHSKYNFIGDSDISAYGSGSTANTEINLENYYTKSEVDDLIDNIDVGEVNVDLSNYYTKSEVNSSFASNNHSHSGYSPTSHTHNYTSIVKLGDTSYNVSANTISLPSYPTLSSLGGVSESTFYVHSGDTTKHITAAERTNWNAAYTNNHTHSNKTVLDGITSTKVSNWDKVYSNWNNVFEINSNGDLRVKVNVIGDKEISAYGSGETSSSSGVIDIVDNLTSTSTTAALSANQGRVLKNLIDGIDVGDIDLSGYSKTSHTHSNYSLTSHTHSNYSVTSHTHSQYASSSHTHPISAITSLQSTLDGKSGTGHSHSNYSLTSHTHSNYSVTSHTHSLSSLTSTAHTHPISAITSLQSTLDSKSGTAHTHSNYSVTSHTHSNYSLTSHTHNYAAASHTHTYSQISDAGTYVYDATISRTANTVLAAPNGSNGKASFRSLVAADIPSLAISKITNLQSSLDAKSGTGHTHNYAGSSSAGGAATSANKVNSTLSFSAGTFSANSFNGSAAKTVYVPTHTSHITNNSGFITTAATVTNADKLDGYHGSSANTASNYVLRGSSGQINVGSISAAGTITATGEVTAHSDRRLKSNTQQLTNRGYIIPQTYIKDGKESIGFIAQDVQELYPELVIVDESTEEKYLSVNYMQYTAVLQAQIIELKDEIEKLKEIIINQSK